MKNELAVHELIHERAMLKVRSSWSIEPFEARFRKAVTAIHNGLPPPGGCNSAANKNLERKCPPSNSGSEQDDEDGGESDGEPARRSLIQTGSTTASPLFTFHQLSQHTTFGRSRIYQLIADRDLKFPAPIKIGKSSRWLRLEVDEWLVKQAASRVEKAR